MPHVDLNRLSLWTASFRGLRAANQIYVDKTDLIAELASGRGKIFLARPRRFGKSLLVSAFESLFRHGLEGFKGLAIEQLWKDKTYDVVHMDFSRLRAIRSIDDFKIGFRSAIIKAFYPLGFRFDAEDRYLLFMDQLSMWLESLPLNSLVLLLDEYDAPLTDLLNNPELFEQVRDEINSFFLTLKQCDDCIRFFFMTGITKYRNTNIFSGFNIFTDISLNKRYGAILGFTEEEIRQYFCDYLENAGYVLGMTSDAVLEKMRVQYDGFSFDNEVATHVYCPWSVLNFLRYPEEGFKNYWYSSAGQPSALMEYIKGHALERPENYAEEKYVQLKDLETTRAYAEIDVNVFLTQAGYLTIKEVNPSQLVTLGYPNQEVAFSMAELYADKLLAGNLSPLRGKSQLKNALSEGKAEEVVAHLSSIVSAIDYRSYPIRDEAACRAYIQVLMIGATLVPRVEVHSALGRSDLEVDAGEYHWVFEFKYAKAQADVDAKLAEACEQIRSRRYGSAQQDRKLMRIALVFCGEERQFASFASV